MRVNLGEMRRENEGMNAGKQLENVGFVKTILMLIISKRLIKHTLSFDF